MLQVTEMTKRTQKSLRKSQAKQAASTIEAPRIIQTTNSAEVNVSGLHTPNNVGAMEKISR